MGLADAEFFAAWPGYAGKDHHSMDQSPSPTDSLAQAAARQIRKLYCVLLRVLEEDRFLPADELDVMATRLARIFRNGAGIYQRRNLAPQDLRDDFAHLFEALIQSTLRDELYEQTANLSRVRARFEAQTAGTAPDLWPEPAALAQTEAPQAL